MLARIVGSHSYACLRPLATGALRGLTIFPRSFCPVADSTCYKLADALRGRQQPATYLESVDARVLVHQPLHCLVALDLHNLLVAPLMQLRQLARPLMDLRLRILRSLLRFLPETSRTTENQALSCNLA